MSSNENVQDTTDDIAQEARDEEHLSQSMAKLQDMHLRLRQLRDTVPSLIRPFRDIDSTPEMVYAEFAKAATAAVTNTKDFVTLMKSRSVQDVLLEARKSRSENPDGITGWFAQQHDDWFDKPLTPETRKDHSYGLEESESTWTSLPLQETVQIFEKNHPDAKLVVQGGEEIQYAISGPTELLFRIRETKSPTGSPTYLVACEKLGQIDKQGKIRLAITQALSQRPRQFDLGYTLLLLSTYSDIMSRNCSKCNRLVDPSGLLPVIRQRSAADDATAQSRALHFGCV